MKFLSVVLISLSLLLISSSRSAQADDDDEFFDDNFDENEDPDSAEIPVEAPPAILGASFGGPLAQAPKLQPQQIVPLQQQQGGNYANINETCGAGTGRFCNEAKNLVCESGRCTCKPNLVNLDLGYVYSPVGDKCYLVSNKDNHFSCDVHEQCTGSKLGQFSRCNSAFTCECFDTTGRYRSVIKKEGVCYVQKEIGDSCETDMECDLTIVGEAVCLGLTRTIDVGICQCAEGHDFDPLLKECLKRGSLNSTCKADSQCNKALGELAFCNPKTVQCECKNVGDKETGHLNGRCYYKRDANETCTAREECVLGYGTNAECLKHPAYFDEMVCQCPPNKECSGTTFQVSVGVILFGIIAAHIKSLY